MKIICQGCSAQYSVADPKVANRTPRIVPCERCGEPMVVRGSVVERLRGDDEPTTQRRARRIAKEERTAFRDENSILFSLSTLKALSTTRTSSPPTRGDSSGSISIGAHAASAGAAVSGTPRADELLAFGGPSLGRTMLGPPLIPPPEAEKKPSGGLGFGLGVTTAICAAAVAVLLLLPASERAALAQHSRLLGDTLTRLFHGADAPNAIEAPAPVVASREASADELSSRPDTFAPELVSEALEITAVTSTDTEPVQASPRSEHREHRRAAREAEVQARGPIAEPSEADPSDESDVEALIRQAVGSAPAHDSPIVATATPRAPTRSDIVNAMDVVSAPVRACGGGARGVVPVRIVFAGETGRASRAEVQETTVAPAVRSCIARAVRDAHVPRFREQTFSVTYPFRL